jgi:hypothetical protein
MAGWLGGRGQASGRNHRLNLYEFFAREEVYRARGNIQPTAAADPLGRTIVIPAEGNLPKRTQLQFCRIALRLTARALQGLRKAFLDPGNQ